MSPSRRTVHLILALALTSGGAASLLYVMFVGPTWPRLIVVATTAATIGGAVWLWETIRGVD